MTLIVQAALVGTVAWLAYIALRARNAGGRGLFLERDETEQWQAFERAMREEGR